MSEQPLRILFVCTANRFRSPLAAATLARQLDGLPVEVESRGTMNVGAMPPLPQAITEAQGFELDLGRHRARQLDRDDVEHAALLIGFEERHLEAARELGAASGRVFALEEIVALLEDGGDHPRRDDYEGSLLAMIAAADARRDPDAEIDWIADPVRRPPREAAAIARRVHLLALRLGRALTP